MGKYANIYCEFADALDAYAVACRMLYVNHALKNEQTNLEPLRIKHFKAKLVVLNLFNNVLTELQNGENKA